MIDWRSLFTGVAVGQVVGPFVRIFAVAYLAIGAFVLVMVWQEGPGRYFDAQRMAAFTGRTEGRIVESWLAMEFEPSKMGSSTYWRGFARATPCAVVEYEGDWGTTRRAFCGTRWHFHEHITIHDLREMTRGVPFDFLRDENGFAMAEMRMGKAAHAWLSKPKEPWGFMAPRTAKRLGHYSELDELRVRIDRPVDLAVVSWSQPPPVFKIAFDPAHPADSLPAGFVEATRDAEPNYLPFAVGGIVGLAFWLHGMNILLMGLVPIGRIVIGALPLLLLPWWSEHLPKFLEGLNKEVAETVADEFGDINLTRRVVASDPEEATQRDGERVMFSVGKGLYAQTLGRLHYRPPQAPFANADAALAALAASTMEQVRAMDASARAELFEDLRADKAAHLMNAGLAFLPAAKETMGDARTPEAQRNAYRFLSQFVEQPLPEPIPNEPAFRQRIALYRSLTDIPVTVIAYPASLIAERAEEKAIKAEAAKTGRRRR